MNQLQKFRAHGVHVLGSFIFGLPSDRSETFAATLSVAQRSEISFAQFVMLTPFPGTIDFAKWEKELADPPRIAGIPITRHWLIPAAQRPKIYSSHPVLAPDEIRERTQEVWDRFYSFPQIWKRAQCVRSTRAKLAFVFISKLFRQMYANTGMATDSVRAAKSGRWACWLARPCRVLFAAKRLPHLAVP